MIKDNILKSFEDHIQHQTSFYVTQQINYVFNESHIKKGKTKVEVSDAYSVFLSQIKIDDWFAERLQELNKIIDSKDYQKAILSYNNKGLHTIVEKNLGISSYSKKAIEYLRVSKPAQNILRNIFPDEIKNSMN